MFKLSLVTVRSLLIAIIIMLRAKVIKTVSFKITLRSRFRVVGLYLGSSWKSGSVRVKISIRLRLKRIGSEGEWLHILGSVMWRGSVW